MLLLGRSERHEDDVGRGILERACQPRHRDGVLLEAVLRAVGTGDLDAWIALLEHLGRAHVGPFVSTEEKDRTTAPRRAGAERGDQVRARHPLGHGRALQRKGPYEDHAVDDAQVRLFVHAAELELLLRAPQVIQVRRDDPAPATLLELVEDVLDRLGFADGMDSDAAQLDLGQRHAPTLGLRGGRSEERERPA